MPTVDEAVEHITWAAGDSFLSNYLDEVLADFFIEEDGEIERGRKVMEFVIHWTIIIGMFYGEIREWKKLLSKK